jgi:hypothetical protein
VVSFRSQLLNSHRKSHWYLLDRRLGGHQSWSGHGSKEKNSQPLLELEPLIIQPVAQCYTTDYSGSLEKGGRTQYFCNWICSCLQMTKCLLCWVPLKELVSITFLPEDRRRFSSQNVVFPLFTEYQRMDEVQNKKINSFNYNLAQSEPFRIVNY